MRSKFGGEKATPKRRAGEYSWCLSKHFFDTYGYEERERGEEGGAKRAGIYLCTSNGDADWRKGVGCKKGYGG